VTRTRSTHNRTSADAIACYDLGLVPYEPLQQLQGEWRRGVAAGTRPGALMLLEHEPVITLGARTVATRAARAHVPRNHTSGAVAPQYQTDAGAVFTSRYGQAGSPSIPVVQSERGGLATLHAPGQLVSYPIIPLPHKNLRSYVWGLEEVLVLLLREWGIEAERRAGRPGLYVADAKIASVGIRCERWVTSHGTSLNICPDLTLFDLIVSCGDPTLAQTSVAHLGGQIVEHAQAARRYAELFARVFNLQVSPPQPIEWEKLRDLP